MGYMEELRQLIGSRPVIMVGAGVIILNEHNHLLLVQRRDNAAWSIPGGAMELGETLQEAARRETEEEVGLYVQEMTFYNIYSGPELFYQYPNGDQVYNVTVIFVAHQPAGELKLDEESIQARYFPLDDLPEISPPLRPVLADYAARERR
jgi:8-oxo-dGTP pyrophosphatase MutT (NUDIX family)